MKRILVALLLMASPAMASIQDTIPITYQGESVGAISMPSIKTIHCLLILSGSSYPLELPEGSTVSTAVEAVARVKYGLVCLDPSGILCINDVCGENGTYWTIKVNGDYQNHSSHSRLSSGDVVEMAYSGKIEHLRLREWLLFSSGGK